MFLSRRSLFVLAAALLVASVGLVVGAWAAFAHGADIQAAQSRRISSYRDCRGLQRTGCFLEVDATVVRRQLDQADAGSSSYWVTVAGSGQWATEDVGEEFWPLLPLHRHVHAQFLNKQLTEIMFPAHEPYFADHYPAADGGIGWFLAALVMLFAAGWCLWQTRNAVVDARAGNDYSAYL